MNVIDEAIEGYVPHTDAPQKAAVRATGFGPTTGTTPCATRLFWLVGISLFFYGGSAFGTGFVLPLFLADAGYDAAGQAAVMTYGSLSSIIFSLAGGIIADRVFHGQRTQVYAISFAARSYSRWWSTSPAAERASSP